ncbi:MAG: aminotransferase class III-fold pyridoxal phosphate-dependent enzyme [Phycisphaerales bacterium]|nr:aminotransferase class III-fold pyridoxal phosphate-dependent enzyme [Phycisphaerales bacterium]
MSPANNTQANHSFGAEFRNGAALNTHIKAIVADLQQQQAKITGVRGPRDDAAKLSYEALMDQAALFRGRPLLYPYIGSGLGNGPYVELADGSVKLDMICGIGVHFFGHGDPDLVAASLRGATGDLTMQGHLMANEDAMAIGDLIREQAAKVSNLRHAFVCSSGAMANESALKVCYQKHEPASRVIAFRHCFMGRSITMAQIGDSAGGRQGIPLSTLVDYMPFYDHAMARRMTAGDVSGPTRVIDMAVWHLEQYIERYPNQHAAFIFELVQGEGGFNTALPEYHRALMEVCKAHNIAVWTDEVQTFGRTERMFCFDAMSLGDLIDICTIGKMSQVCATLFTEAYNPKPGLLSGTFMSSTAAINVGRRVIERLRDGDYYNKDHTPGRIAKHHQLYRDYANALISKHPEWFPPNHHVVDLVGGYGGMMRFTPFGGLKEPVLALCKACFEEGLILFYCGHDPYHVRMLPPLGIMEEAHWKDVFDILERAMAKVAAASGPFESPKIRPLHTAAAR